jgi:ribonuclease P protein component
MNVSTFPKSVRLRKRADFVSLLDSSNKLSVKGFLVVWQNNDRDVPRLGITVSKKIGCAVIRNRIKRFTREIFRYHRILLPPADINVIARRESAMMDFRSVQCELEKAFRRIGTSSCVRAVCSL